MRTDIDLFKLAAVQLSSQRELKRKLKKGLQESLSRRELLQQGAQGDRKAEVFQVKEQKKEYQTGWKIKTGNVLDSCNQRSTQQCTKSRVAKHLGVAGLQQHNGLVKKTNMTLLAKVVLYKNMSFNKSGEYKKTFTGSGVGTGSVQVLQGVEFEEQHSAHELLKYREDSNEAAFAVAEAEKIYAHESLTFNNTVACEVISKWKAGLKDDIGCLGQDVCAQPKQVAESCTTTMSITGSIHQGSEWKYSEGVTVQVLQREVGTDFVGGTLHTVVGGSLSGDCDVEKNGKWSCIYAVGSQEYQMVCTRLDMASEDVGMLDKFDRGLLIGGFHTVYIYNI
ncbi:hypothetical protein Tco_1244847 [Tanacetum coccineum]